MEVRAKPMIANRRARQFCAARLYRAGISFRRERSPEAPKITMVQGSAAVRELLFAGASTMATVFWPEFICLSSLFCRRLDRVSTKLISHRREQLVRIRIGVARCQPLHQ